MECSTCGARIPSGRTECTTCGAPAAPPHAVANAAPPVSMPEAYAAAEGAVYTIPVCPRCGHQGKGLGYFSTGRHLAALALLGILFFPFAILYLGMRWGYEVCPRCGLGWGRNGARAGAGKAFAGAGGWGEIEDGGVPKKAIVLAVLAVALLAAGIAAAEIAPLVLAAAAGTGAYLVTTNARERSQRRSEALLAALAPRVLKLAHERGGRLTVTQVAADLGWPMRRAERVLESLEDGLRVNSEVSDSGVIVYEFRELLYPPDPAR